MSSTIANLSSSSMDLLGKGAMTSRADSSRSGSLTSLAAPSASSQLEFKRLLSEASEKKSAAREASDRQQAEKQAQSERLEARRHESRQLEKQEQQERQAAKQNEKHQIEEKQQESRQSEHGLREDRLTQAAQQKRLQDDVADTQRSVTQGTEIPVDIHESSLNEPSALNQPLVSDKLLAVSDKPSAVSDKPSATTQPSELQSLTGGDSAPETGELSAEDSAKDKEGASNAAAEAENPDKAGGEQHPLFSTSPDAAETLAETPKTGLAQNPVSVNEASASAGLVEGEISLEAIAEAVAAFTGLGEISSGGLSASQSVLASSSGSVNGLSLGASGAASQFSLVQNLSLSGSTAAGALNGLALDKNSLASGKTAGTEQPPLMGAVGAGATTGIAARQMSSVTAAQPQTVDQALDAFSAESGTAGQDSSGDSSREGLRGGAGDNPLLAAAQRSEGRSVGPAQSAAHFTVPTSKGELGQPEWHNAVAEKVAVMATKNLSSAEIQLDPPELGQLQVRVTLNQEQASVSFASQNAAVREALDQTAFRLREMFDAEGLNLVDVDVSDQSFQQQRQQQESLGSGGEGVIGTDDVSAEPVTVKRSQGLVDHFV